MNPFTSIQILPGYATGFTFVWDLLQGFKDPLPWTFAVYQSDAQDEGPWNKISPDLVNRFSWPESGKRVISKDPVLFFRISLTTPDGTYYSHTKAPYGELDRREYLIAREIMRREVLQMRKLSGVPTQLWVKSVVGAPCTKCTDPVTGTPLSGACSDCMGTGKSPAYHGPYMLWATFSPAQRNTEMKKDGAGLSQQYNFNVRLVGFPYIKDNDVLVDTRSDKRYYVDGVKHLTELRRIPIIQTAMCREIPTSDPAYKLGMNVPEDELVCPGFE